MIQELIDTHLLKEQEEKNKRVRSGKWTPSRFGRCYRMQFLARKLEPETNPPDVSALRRFKMGNLIHSYMQEMFPTAQKEVKVVLEPDLIGFADIVMPEEVVDIKSCRSYEFKKMDEPGYRIGENKEGNCLQVSAYSWLLNKPQARLIFIEKDKLDSKEFVIQTSDWVDKLAEELDILRGYWKQDKLPPAMPRLYSGKEGAYCPFLNRCLELGFDCINKVKL